MIDGATEDDLRRWKQDKYKKKDIKNNVNSRYMFFNIGFYISLIIWACGIAFSIIGGELFDISPVVRLISIFVPLGIYMFFLIGKSNIEEKIRKNERY